MQKIRLEYTRLGIINRIEKIKRRIKQRKESNIFRREMLARRNIRNYYAVSSKEIKGKIIEIINKMEERLEIILVRMMLAKSIFESRQLIVHGKVLLNGIKVKSPKLKVKEGDIIEVLSKINYKITTLNKRIINLPEYLEVNYNINTGIKVKEPSINNLDIPGGINRFLFIR